MPRLETDERQLVPDWSIGLIILSYCISWLGAYTSTQIIIHAKYSRTRAVRWMWTFLASVAFGFTAIWSMHFVGMHACRLDVKITYDIPLTILSAAVAVAFTFAAFSSVYAPGVIQKYSPMVQFTKWFGSGLDRVRRSLSVREVGDVESGRLPGPASEERRPILSSASDEGEREADAGYDEDERALEGNYDSNLAQRRTATDATLVGDSRLRSSTDSLTTRPSLQNNMPEPTFFSTSVAPLGSSHRSPPPLQADRDDSEVHASARTSEDSTPVSSAVSSDESFVAQPLSTDSSARTSSDTPTSLSSLSWSDPLHAGLSREARLRIKAHARDKPVPNFGWRYWCKQYYSTASVIVGIRAAIWGLAIVFMHYCGMWAMEIPEGRIEWDWRIVIMSYVVAFSVCLVGCIAMMHMEVHFGRQMAFSIIAAMGVCSMHYTGMQAATFYTKAPPSSEAGYPTFLPFTILGVAAIVCVISNAVLAHSAITSRNHMAEVILTKRRLWRIMAEKEAAEQANELKQQFISVASHEIRTPLHAVNGYCELLAMTKLTEEQSAYVTSIQQACHAINVIAGNVLDFSKLDRNNVELSARPVLLDLRKMAEDQARIIETRELTQPHPAVDVIVSVDPDVPPKVYLDETYTYRILMNLLSNAQKFCEEGYVCVSVSMESANRVAIKISDTGCGIPKSFRNALFQPFRQADSSLTRPKQGTGLGLSIVKHLVQRMSGSVDVESTEGEGSIFTVKLPVTVPNSSPFHLETPLASNKRVKVVYRFERTAKLLSELWARHGLSVSLVPPTVSVADLLKDTDVIWTDTESVKRSSALKEVLGASATIKMPRIFIVHSDTQDLEALEPALSKGNGVILVKRPIVTHGLLEMFEDQGSYLGSDSMSHHVRFALPSGRTPMDERKVELGVTDAIGNDAESQEIQRYTVLLVEDNVVNQNLGRRLLERLGYDVVTANNGKEAVDEVTRTTFYCCFMDCQMPILDGFAATVKIRELENSGTVQGRLPVIALTANVSTESEAKCRAAGMDYFLPKPFKMADLQTALTQAKIIHP